ncbi:hypothetical protein FSP39_008048 [Pinctada imbricata]|uniref:Uncharacterized protein n=1 Tax=Pinctada imbricata TaxID=66713 RepID=A0AA88YCW8_PINIB|nr:hypothetical protein FSP39_008048 [Pinctada imbricata]
MTSRVHDPLFHYETHFPERLSRLHLTPDLGPQTPQRRNRRTRSSRQDIRYKTQPVTFDEIQEVDEENIQEENNLDGIRQFQAFSRSMDGLIPKITNKGEKKSADKSQSSAAEKRLQDNTESNKENNNDNSAQTSSDKPVTSPAKPTGNAALPPTGLSRDPRRQRMSAKAKRRQMMAEAREGD